MTTAGEKALRPTQVELLLSVIDELKDLSLIKLAVAGGIRREDIIKILTKDVNFKENSVTFYQKKKKHTHTVFLPKSVMNTLAMSMKIHKKTPYLFPSKRKNKHISSKTAYNILQRYLKRADLNQRPFHALRATCYKLCQKKGWPVEQCAKHLDDTIRVAQQHYATPSPEEMKETAQSKEVL